jgi:hypothetical protein
LPKEIEMADDWMSVGRYGAPDSGVKIALNSVAELLGSRITMQREEKLSAFLRESGHSDEVLIEALERGKKRWERFPSPKAILELAHEVAAEVERAPEVNGERLTGMRKCTPGTRFGSRGDGDWQIEASPEYALWSRDAVQEPRPYWEIYSEGNEGLQLAGFYVKDDVGVCRFVPQGRKAAQHPHWNVPVPESSLPMIPGKPHVVDPLARLQAWGMRR